MINPITYDKIVERNKQIFSALKEDNEMAGYVLDGGTLHHIVITSSYYNCFIKKAAWYLHSLSAFAPFVQGNKRTARRVSTDILMMGKQRYELSLDDDDVTKYIIEIGNSEHDFSEVESWLRENITEII